MSRISGIITRVRDTLADPNGDRWSDERLIRLIDEAQKDICRRAKLLRTKGLIPIRNNTPTITLPSDMLLLDRVLFLGDKLPLVSHLELDRDSGSWEEETGTPKFLVYDKQSKYSAKLYPIPDNLDLDNYFFTSTGYIDDGIQVNTDPNFGMISSIDGIVQNMDYGILTSLSIGTNLSEQFQEDNLGVSTKIDETSNILVIYYLKKPTDIVDVDQVLEIDDIFDAAIKYYVTGKSLRDDMDTQNRVVGNEELQFYDRELKEAISDDMMDYTRANTQYSAKYQGAFNG